jgi:osmotically-inducible protein OsmY
MLKPRFFGKYLACFCLISALLGCATTQSERAKQHFDDQTVTAKVKAALSTDPSLGKFSIDVKTIRGEVVLEGKVDSIEDVYKAAEIVNRVEGVKSLFNDLDVK